MYGRLVRLVGFFLLVSLYLPWDPSRTSFNLFSNELPKNVPAAALGTSANNRLVDVNCSTKSILPQDPMTLDLICVPFYVFYSPMNILNRIDFENTLGIGKAEGWISSLVYFSSSYSSEIASQIFGYFEDINTLSYVSSILPKGERLLLVGWGLLYILATGMITFKCGLKPSILVAAFLAWSESTKLPLQMGVGFYGVMISLAMGFLLELGRFTYYLVPFQSLLGSKAEKSRR